MQGMNKTTTTRVLTFLSAVIKAQTEFSSSQFVVQFHLPSGLFSAARTFLNNTSTGRSIVESTTSINIG